jgi:hypothetical protein
VRRKSIEIISQFKYLFSLDKKRRYTFYVIISNYEFLEARKFFLFEVDNLLKG